MRRKLSDRRLRDEFTEQERRSNFARRQVEDRRVVDLHCEEKRRTEDIEKLQQDNAEVINLPLMP